MFEEIVEKKYKPLKILADEIKTISIDSIKNSDLPVFAVNFLLAEQVEINDRNTLNSLLEKSVKLIVNYSLRPKWTIVNYLFGGFDSKPADEILRKAEVFRFYRYYIDLITNHIKDHSLLFITQDDVKFLADEANKVVLEKLVNKTSSVKIKNFFSQIYKLKYGDDKEINLDWSAPFLFIKLFLEDKGFDELLNKFNIIPGLDDSMEIEMKTAIKVLTDKYYVNSDFFVLKDEPPKTKNETSFENNLAPDMVKEQEQPQKTEQEIIPEEKTEHAENIPEEIKQQPIKETEIIEENKSKGLIRIIKNIPAKRFHREKKTTEVKTKPVGEQIETLTSPEEPEKIHKKREKIHGEDKIRYIFKGDELKAIQKKIFKDSKSTMMDTFDELETFDNWNEASAFLKEIFIKNRVDFYNKYTVLFVDLLNDYFLKIEKGK